VDGDGKSHNIRLKRKIPYNQGGSPKNMGMQGLNDCEGQKVTWGGRNNPQNDLVVCTTTWSASREGHHDDGVFNHGNAVLGNIMIRKYHGTHSTLGLGRYMTPNRSRCAIKVGGGGH